jgi:hypothetical protein
MTMDMYTVYFEEPIQVGTSDIYVVGMRLQDSPLALTGKDIIGVREYDLPRAFPLMPYLARLSESESEEFQGSIPKYAEVRAATEKANKAFTEAVGS